MRRERIEYDSPVDALVSITRRLATYEDRYHMSSEEFFDRYSKGQLTDSADFVEWAGDYQHYLAVHRDLENQLRRVA